MSTYCSVKSCRNSNKLPISFFKVPPRLSKQWRLVLDRGMRWTPKPNSKICMVHFSSDQYNKRGLLRGVEPNSHPLPLPDFPGTSNVLKDILGSRGVGGGVKLSL